MKFLFLSNNKPFQIFILLIHKIKELLVQIKNLFIYLIIKYLYEQKWFL